MKAWRVLVTGCAIALGVLGAGAALPPVEDKAGLAPIEDETPTVLVAKARAEKIQARPAPFPGDIQRSADALDMEWLAARRQAATRRPD